jgi:hypothetical protein
MVWKVACPRYRKRSACEIRQSRGLYYRESSTAEPSQQAMEVLKLVIENDLPISMSSKPDFADYIMKKVNRIQIKRGALKTDSYQNC